MATAGCFSSCRFIDMIKITEVTTMETKNIILKLRTGRGMSQDELADKIMVTRQADKINRRIAEHRRKKENG